MRLFWRTSDAIEGGFQTPEKVTFFFDDGRTRRAIDLKQVEAYKVGDFIRSELGHHEGLLSLKMESNDLQLSFLFLINPTRKVIYIPPGALVTNRNFPGAGKKMQSIFEQIALKNGYKLMVCIVANEAGVFNQRVQSILNENEGYHLAPPQKKGPHTKQFGIHKSTYDHNGIPELGVRHEDMVLSGDD